MILSNIAATDPIIGPSRGSAQGWIDWVEAHRKDVKRPDDVIAYIKAVYELCAPDDMPDAFIVIADAFHETGNFTNRWWNERLNAGSLGVTGDPTQNEASPTFKNVAQAARAHVAHLLLYATGQINRGGLKPADDPRYSAYRDAYGETSYPTLQGLTGRYAADPFYAAKIAQRQQEIYPIFTTPIEQPEGGNSVVKDSEGFELNMTPGLIPEAGYANRLVPDANNSAWDNLGPRTVRGVTLHRMLGSLEGTDNYFNQHAPGLTDMGAKASSNLVYRWNDETGAPHPGVSANRAPWASGPYKSAGAYGDGAKFVAKRGIDAINRDRRSLEIDQFYGDPWSAASMGEYAQTTAHDAHNYGITWEQFPYSPKDDCSFVCWHNEFCGTAYKECPGSIVMGQTDDFIALVKGIMKAAQQVKVTQPGEPPPVVVPVPVNPYPKGATEEWVRVVYGSVKVSWASKPFTFDINRSECRAWLLHCTSTIPQGGDYTQGQWGPLEKVIRRGKKGVNGRDYLYGNEFIYRQEPPDKQHGPVTT